MPRDKFAAMASRAAASSTEADNPHNSAPNVLPGSTDEIIIPTLDVDLPVDDTAASSSSPRSNQQYSSSNTLKHEHGGDKLAALSSRASSNPDDTDPTRGQASSTGRGNKLAALAAAAGTTKNNDDYKNQSENVISTEQQPTKKVKLSPEEIAKQRQEYRMKLQQRLSKRKYLLDRLDRAEELTCNLLRIASKTTDALQDLHRSPDLSELAVAYRSTLQEIHPLLTKETEELIKPYQNHTMETKQSMYAARVEMRLAKERLEVLKTFTDLEMTNAKSSPSSTTDTVGVAETSSRKRSREEET